MGVAFLLFLEDIISQQLTMFPLSLEFPDPAMQDIVQLCCTISTGLGTLYHKYLFSDFFLIGFLQRSPSIKKK